LTGRYASAVRNAKEALKIKPDDPRAAYTGGRAAEQVSRASTEAGRGADLNEARQFYTIAFQNTAAESATEKQTIEQELNGVIKLNAERYKQVAVGYDDPLNCKDDDAGLAFGGTINLPELKSKGIDVSGPARLYFVGNQFKLVPRGGEVYTGTFSTTTTGRYTAVALRFDSPSVGNQTGVTVSLRGMGNCDRLRLQSSKFGGINMAAVSGDAFDRPK